MVNILLNGLKEIAKSVVIAIIAALLIIRFIFQTVNVDGQSMLPTLRDGDKLILEKVTYYLRDPKADDVVVFKYPSDPTQKFIKRVVAVAGQSVMIDDNKLFIDGVAQDEPYINEHLMSGHLDKVIVPKNTIFVLGDNRNDSRDSRYPDVGFVNLDLVVGKAAFRIYPLNKIGKVR